jgi:hypothetical protein
MKNPMKKQLEKRLAERALAIGRAGEVEAFGQLLELLKSSTGTCGDDGVGAAEIGAAGSGSARRWQRGAGARGDSHPQARQYAIRALKAYGAAAQGCLHDLRDQARNPAEKPYIRRDAAAAAAFIQRAVRAAAASVERHCQRCNARVTPEEYARSEQVFQRVFCDRCFDEVFLARRNFETQVEITKTIVAPDGTVVQTEGERRIAEWLTAHGIAYRYDAKFRIIGEFQIRPDFYLPELDVYIEYWGLDTPHYKMSMYKKQMLYQQAGKRLISVHPQDLPGLDGLLTAKLRHFGYNHDAGARCKVSQGERRIGGDCRRGSGR